jgi:predicted Zn-dependent protease
VVGPEYFFMKQLDTDLRVILIEKKTSAFSDLMGQKIADEQVTVVDDGTIENRRGSITTIDDEGSSN